MLGSIIGDIVGCPFEFQNYKGEDFEFFSDASAFTDDTVMTVATMDAIVSGTDYGVQYHQYGNTYPKRGYGSMFKEWLENEKPQPYGSFGNGSAMRVSPVGIYFNSLAKVRIEAEKTALPTHNHPDGVKGAVAVAEAIFYLRQGSSLGYVFGEIESRYYKIDLDLPGVRSKNTFNETCEGAVPVALTAFFNSKSFEDCIRKAVSLGGDSDTIAAIAGGLAEARFGIPPNIVQKSMNYLSPELVKTIASFYQVLSKIEK